MRILYDGAVYSAQSVGGITRYFDEVIARLPGSVSPVILSARSRTFPPHPNLEVHCRELRWPKLLKPFERMAQRHYFRRRQQTLGADVLHPTYYGLLSKAKAAARIPKVVTVYDCIHERFPETLDADGRNARLKRQAIETADAIICISEHTRRDLLELYRVPAERVSVIHLATEIGEVAPAEINAPRPRPYFLYVGSRASYKNFDRLLTALANLLERRAEISLCVAGGAFSKTEQERIERLGLSSRIAHCGPVDDGQLKTLYQQSLALVYPSRYEGFGIPVLEAMACGTAVVAAETSSIPEVAGNAALLFPPESTEALTEHLWNLIRRPALRGELVALGRVRAAQFSWQKTADAHMSVYQGLASRKRSAA